MIFVYSKWAEFCKELKEKGIVSIPANEILRGGAAEPYLVLKHDVETDVKRARRMAAIEQSFGHRGSYYVQAYLLEDKENVELLQEICEMGHEVSYHYDVLDSSKGDMEKAKLEFERNLSLFRNCGFSPVTVCQHGNPIVERKGYHSNRDFFRNPEVQKIYPQMADIMVDFKMKAETEYLYFSDAGRRFNLIFDPICNDVIPSGERDIPCDDLHEVLERILGAGNSIVSVHPHRWTASAFRYKTKELLFRIIRLTAKQLIKVPFIKKVMAKYYYLAKKI